jgi:Raf kinase inhibitor-like YbhB/YbcL family protein
VPSKPDDVNQEDRIIPATLPRIDFFHWVLVDLDPQKGEIRAGEFSSDVTTRGKAGPTVPNGPPGLRHGVNDYTLWFAADNDMSGDYYGYDGPCPPWNDSIVHHYVFTMYALDVATCGVSGKFNGNDVRTAIKGHVLAEAKITGRYSLNPDVKA